MYIYKSLENTSYKQITDCFNSAFSDYSISMSLTEQQVENRLKLSGIDMTLSFGAFLDEEMIGFIFNSCNIYNNAKVVFDIGTGIVPDHRGNKVFTNMFKTTVDTLQKNEVKKYYLEVLQQNEKALTIYKKQGFEIIREYTVMKSNDSTKGVSHGEVEFSNFGDFNFDSLTSLTLVKPSYEHSSNILKLNPDAYKVALYKSQDTITAFCIYDKDNGGIVEIGYSNIMSLKSIIETLLIHYNTIFVKNVDLNYPEVINIFESLDFIELVKQYEMVRNIE